MNFDCFALILASNADAVKLPLSMLIVFAPAGARGTVSNRLEQDR
jgi:hypothetical protein